VNAAIRKPKFLFKFLAREIIFFNHRSIDLVPQGFQPKT
jgi:hypothetical protein